MDHWTQKVSFQGHIPLQTKTKKKHVPLGCILLSLTVLIYTQSHTAGWKTIPFSPNRTTQPCVHSQRTLQYRVHGWENKLPLWPTLLFVHKVSPSSITDITPFGLLDSLKKEKLVLSVRNCCAPGMDVLYMTVSACAGSHSLLQAAQEWLCFLLSLPQVNNLPSVATKCLDGCWKFLEVRFPFSFGTCSKRRGKKPTTKKPTLFFFGA